VPLQVQELEQQPGQVPVRRQKQAQGRVLALEQLPLLDLELEPVLVQDLELEPVLVQDSAQVLVPPLDLDTQRLRENENEHVIQL
jgi:hypothetical protein